MNISRIPQTLNAKLALFALAMGFLALLAGQPSPRTTSLPEIRRLAHLIETRLDHIEAGRLDSILASGGRGYQLIDVRDSSEYAAGHIPGASNMLLDSLVVAEFLPADTVILYSEAGIHAAQGMYLLWTRGHTAVLTLRGGMESWRDAFPADTVKSHGAGKRIMPNKPPAHEREKARDEC